MKITAAEITQAVDLAATLATALGPQAAALIALGRVVAAVTPALYDDVVKLLQKAEPTAEEKADLARKLHALANPETA